VKAANAVAKILKKEGVEFLIGYPVNQIIEAAAEEDIRTIIVRQERVGLHMADAVSRISSGQRIGVFAMQHGPGTENAFGGVAQAFGDSVPIVVLPGGYPRKILNITPNFSSLLNFQHVTKWCEQVILPESIPDAMRRAFTQVKNGRPRPVLVEIPVDVMRADVPDDFVYTPAPRLRTGPDPQSVTELAAALVAANRLVIYAGQGVHYARAWKQLRELAELLEAPVTTSLQGKSAFPENHPLSLGSGGRSISKQLHHFLNNADLIFGIGCSFTTTNYGVAMPKGKRIAHATLDPLDINKDIVADIAVAGDAALTLDALIAARPPGGGDEGDRHAEAGVAGPVDAAAHAEDLAAVALSRAVGSDAHGRRRQHDHHPRRRQPARSDLAVLGADRAADLHRLGQDHPARLRPGPGHGRQAGPAREALHQLLG
jgi:thiamine pyrophosphate-dependent acetolactate synthase large subunit-like protein